MNKRVVVVCLCIGVAMFTMWAMHSSPPDNGRPSDSQVVATQLGGDQNRMGRFILPKSRLEFQLGEPAERIPIQIEGLPDGNQFVIRTSCSCVSATVSRIDDGRLDAEVELDTAKPGETNVVLQVIDDSERVVASGTLIYTVVGDVTLELSDENFGQVAAGSLLTTTLRVERSKGDDRKLE